MIFKTLLKSFQSSDWSMALDFLSPTFFEVVPTLGMTRVMGGLSRNYLNRSLLEETKKVWIKALPTIDGKLSWNEDSTIRPLAADAGLDRQALGQTLLKLYFSSLLIPSGCFLDLRSDRFLLLGSKILWQPKPWIHSWSAEFREAMLAIYTGFYGDQPAVFRGGLKVLHLEHAESLFLNIFGEARSQAIVFRLAQFQSSFHQIFLSCRQHKTQLHPEFLPLGLLLFALYEHAEKLGIPLNPGQAFKDVLGFKSLFESMDQGVSV